MAVRSVRRRAFVAVSSGLVLSLVSGFLVATPLAAAPPRPADAAGPAERSVPVRPASSRQPSVARSDQEQWSARATVWPASGVSIVDIPTVAAARAQVGGTPIRVGRASAAAATGSPARARVEVLDRSVTEAARVQGVLLRLSRADDVPAAGSMSLEVDYSGFADAFGGDWAARLSLVRLPGCALVTPEAQGCQLREVVPTRNDLGQRRLVADVQVAPRSGAAGDRLADGESATSVYAVAATASSPETGDFTRTSLAPSYSWQAGTSAGDFSWSYNMRVPPAPGGLAPQVSLGYRSAGVDGRTNGASAQPSWVGEGWDYEPGYVERSYRSCADDTGSHKAYVGGWTQTDKFLPLADYDGDGKVDIGVIGDGQMFIHLNTSTPGTPSKNPTAVALGAGWGPVDTFLAGDYDTDGKVDLVGRAGSDLLVWRNTGTVGSPSFGPATFFGSGWHVVTKFLPLADYDNDGKVDIAIVGNDQLFFHRNTSSPGSPSKAAGTYISSGWGIHDTLMAGDYDTDGKTDIVGRGNDYLHVWRGTGTVGSTPVFAYSNFGTGWNNFSTFVPLKDYDGDGKVDIAGVGNGKLFIHLNTSTPGTPSKAAGQLISEGWGTVDTFLAGDFDTDAKMDLIGRTYDDLYIVRGVGSAGSPRIGTYYVNATQDLCWRDQNATLVWGGRSTELVLDSVTGAWRLGNDDGSRIERLTGAANYDDDGEHWRLTTPDGTQYFFGLTHLPGWTSGKPETLSVRRAPVFANHLGEPCLQPSGFANSWCHQAYRWNLDYVVDPHGNSMSYWYFNEYHRSGLAGATSPTAAYERGGVLERIEYGTRAGSELTTTAPARVVFTNGERCLASCWSGGSPVAANWPDVPWDLWCLGSSCSNNITPSFWTVYRLAKVTTQTWTGSAWRDVDEWALTHGFPATGDAGKPVLWLSDIAHTGKVGGTASLPAIHFGGTRLRNRADYNPSAGMTEINKYRIGSITTESGGEILVSYQGSDCGAGNTPNPDNNYRQCFPQYYVPPTAPPGWAWWNKYRVSQVVERDLVGGSPDVVHAYAYSTAGSSSGVLWHHNDQVWSTALAKRSWSDFRGWSKVVVTTGAAGGVQSQSSFLYFRGLDQDRTDAGNYTRDAKITNSLGEVTEDQSHLAGMLHERIDHAAPGSQALAKTISTPWQQQTALRTMSTTVSVPPLQRAFFTRTATTRSLTWLAASSSWRTTRVESTFDTTYGQPTTVKDLGDIAVGSDDVCMSMSYARNTTAWLIEYVAQTLVTDCAPAPGPANHLGGRRTFYDGSTVVGAAPSRGLATRMDELASFTGSTANWVTAARAEHDALGRHTKAYDGLNRATTMAYTPATSGLVTGLAVTNPAGHVTTSTVQTAWGLPLSVVDANNKTTTAAYDPLGRLVKVWLPGRSVSLTPNAEYAYNLRGTVAASSSTTKRLGPNGNQIVSHETYDGLLRVRQAQATAPDGKRVVADTAYDSRGLAVKSSVFYNNASGPTDTLAAFTDASVATQTTRVYDGLARQTASIVMSLGVEKWRTSTAYDGDRVLVTPPTGGTAATAVTDANGRTVELRQHTAATPTGAFDATTYTYDRLDRLTRVTDPVGNDWDYAYDLRGRKTQTTDPDTGVTSTTYDNANQLSTTTNARGITLAYAYDSLGRRTAVHQGTLAGAKHTETVYDTVAKGQVTSSTRWHAGQAYTTSVGSYDDGYRPLSTTVVVPAAETGLAGSYAFGATYKVDGSVATQALPAAGGLMAETVTYGHSDTGLPTTLAGLGVYVGSTAYHFDGQVAQRILGAAGKQVRQTYAVDDSTRRLLTIQMDTEHQTTPGTWMDRSTTDYGYDQAGNVQAAAGKTDGVRDQVECFRYDHLHRLTRAFTNSTFDCATAVRAGADAYHRSWTYDVTGNRLTQTDHPPGGDVTTTYTYPAAGGVRPHAVTGTSGGAAYTYDGAGNTLTRPGVSAPQTLEWADDGGLARATEGASATEFVYDAAGNRLVRRDPSGKTLYLPGGMQLRTSGGAVRYYSHGGAVVAVRTSGGLSWQHADRLGTAQATVDSGTLSVSRRRTMPFGEPRGSQPSGWPGDKGYVGGTTDPTGLTHLAAREYDPSIGRFVSVDPIMRPADPQQMHGYAYANNSPVTLSDPNGLEPGSWCTTGACAIVNGQSQTSHPMEVGFTNGAANKRKAPQIKPEVYASAYLVYKGYPVTAVPGAVPYAPQTKASEAAYFLAQRIYEAAHAPDGPGYIPSRGCYLCPFPAGRDLTVHELLDVAGLLPYIGESADALNASLYVKEGDYNNAALSAAGLIPMLGTLVVLNRLRKGARAGANLCAVNSFVPGTLVLMADGSTRPIEDVEVGDEVFATDPTTGQMEGRPVVALIVGDGSKDLVEITVDVDGAAGDETGTVIATDGHPFWVPELYEWVKAADLRSGQWLHTTAGTVQITAIKLWTQTSTVHNLSVSGIHTYYVLAGDTPVLVHNTAPGGCGPNLSNRPGQIADRLGLTTREVRDAIHSVKRDGLPRGGAQRNPDVVVDIDTGEVYVELPDGTPSGDSIGNIFDYLHGG